MVFVCPQYLAAYNACQPAEVEIADEQQESEPKTVGMELLLERYEQYLAGVLGGSKPDNIIQRRVRAVSHDHLHYKTVNIYLYVAVFETSCSY